MEQALRAEPGIAAILREARKNKDADNPWIAYSEAKQAAYNLVGWGAAWEEYRNSTAWTAWSAFIRLLVDALVV